MTLTFGSLFAGVGGFDLGFARAGLVGKWQVEIDEAARGVLAKHFPAAARFGDVKTVTALPGLDQRDGALPDGEEFVAGELAVVGEAMAVRAEDDAVVEGVGTAESLGTDVVNVAGGFGPTAPHTSIGVQTLHRLHPTALCGVDGALGDDVTDALVPGVTTVLEPLCPDAGTLLQLRRAGNAGLVSSGKAARTPLRVEGSDDGATAASANGHIHNVKYSTHSLKYLPPVDVITAGFPCQDVSVAGQRAGLAGARSGLFSEIIRIVKEMREATDGRYPNYVVLENVPGLTNSNRGWDFGFVLDSLAQLGAVDIGWRVSDAQYWGVAQRRRRVFIVCRFGDGADTAEILSLSTGGSWHTPPRPAAGEGLAASLTRGSASGRGVNQPGRRREDDVNLVPSVSLALTTPCGQRQDATAEQFIVEPTPLLEVGARTNGDGYRDGDGIGQPGDPMYTLQAGKQHGVLAPVTTATLTSNGDQHRGIRDAEGLVPIAFTNRAIEGETFETLRAASHGALPMVSHAMAVRRLTPTECSRLQGFPDDWNDQQADSARYRQLGNAVAVPCAAWLGERLVASMSAPTAHPHREEEPR